MGRFISFDVFPCLVFSFHRRDALGVGILLGSSSVIVWIKWIFVCFCMNTFVLFDERRVVSHLVFSFPT